MAEVRPHLLVDGCIEVVVHIQVHKLSAVVLSDHDILAIILEGHSQRLPNARHSSSEVLTEHLLHILCTCTPPIKHEGRLTNLHILLLLSDCCCHYNQYLIVNSETIIVVMSMTIIIIVVIIIYYFNNY